MDQSESLGVLEQKYSRRTFIKGVIATGATVSSTGYLFRGIREHCYVGPAFDQGGVIPVQFTVHIRIEHVIRPHDLFESINDFFNSHEKRYRPYGHPPNWNSGIVE